MTCLIIGIIWIVIRFIAGALAKMTDYQSDMTPVEFFVWVLCWLANIALLIIGACVV